MKKLVLASAIAVLSVSAQAAPTVYGKAFLSLDYEKDGRPQLNSNSSRIGFKGSDKVSENNSVVYKLEYGIKIDDGANNFNARDTYLGIENKQLGTLIAGRLSSIDGDLDYANVTAGNVLGGDATFASDLGRANNALAYVSPNYNGLNFSAMYALDEDKSAVANEAFGVGAKFEPKDAPYRAGATYVQMGDRKSIRVSGAFDVSPAVTVGGLYQNAQFTDGGEKENAFTLSGEFKTSTPWTAYGQFDLVDNDGGVADAERKRVAFGGKYAFNGNATGHLYGAVVDTANAENNYGVGAGLEYKF